MRASTILLSCLLLAGSLSSLPAAGAGGSPPVSAPSPSQAPQAQKSPEDVAKEYYTYGLKHRDKAWKLEDKAAGGSEAQRQKLLAKAKEQYAKAIGRYQDALSKDPNLYQAHSSLGYALRKTGDYEGSLAAYDRALALAPMYAEAIEYRAEAYLALGRLAEAKEAYMQLFELDRARADELMAAMKTWLAEGGSEAAGVGEEALDTFRRWVEERAELADQTAWLSGGSGRVW